MDELVLLSVDYSPTKELLPKRSATYIEIEVVCAQCIKSLLKTLRNIRLVSVPKLASDENAFTGDSTVFYALADFVLVSWRIY